MSPDNVQWIPGGDLGAMQTLREMRRLVNESLYQPLLINTAHEIVTPCRARDTGCQAAAIRAWLAAHFRFVPDPRGVELLRTPAVLLEWIEQQGFVTGDCDDAAVLAAALGKAVGLMASFVVVGFRTTGAPFTHVFTLLRTRDGWAEMDVTRPDNEPIPEVRRHMAWAV